MGQRVGFSSILCCCGLLLIQAHPPDHHPFPPSSAACQLGFYKSAPGDQLCAKCPLHSHSESRAARVCRCDSSFYRAVQDPPSAACTRKYTPQLPWLLKTPCLVFGHIIVFSHTSNAPWLAQHTPLALSKLPEVLQQPFNPCCMS